MAPAAHIEPGRLGRRLGLGPSGLARRRAWRRADFAARGLPALVRERGVAACAAQPACAGACGAVGRAARPRAAGGARQGQRLALCRLHQAAPCSVPRHAHFFCAGRREGAGVPSGDRAGEKTQPLFAVFLGRAPGRCGGVAARAVWWRNCGCQCPGLGAGGGEQPGIPHARGRCASRTTPADRHCQP